MQSGQMVVACSFSIGESPVQNNFARAVRALPNAPRERASSSPMSE